MRYYYDDPLAATWMAKHFGMRFDKQVYLKTEGAPSHTGFLDPVNPSIESGELFYIHPDSLHLLEPQLGDTFQGLNPEQIDHVVSFERWHGGKDARPYLIPVEAAQQSFKTYKNHYKIIQRNGITFIWPKSEL